MLKAQKTFQRKEKNMADVIDYQILGDDLQLVEVELDSGEGVRA